MENRNFEISKSEIICPYCGYSKDVEYEMYFGDNDIAVYEEGEEKVKCPECGHTFRLTKEMSWDYLTEVIVDADSN